MQVPLKPRNVGELIGLSMRLSVAHFPKLFAVTFVLMLPMLVLQLLVGDLAERFADSPGELLAYTCGLMVVGMLMVFLGSAVATTLVAASFTGRRTSLGSAFVIGLRRFLPLIGFMMTWGLIWGLGLLLFVIPGIYLYVRFWVGPAVIVLDGASVGAAFGISSRLTEGRRLKILGFALLMFIITGIPGAIAGGVAGALTGTVDSAAVTATVWLVGVIAGIPGIVAPVAMYFDLRVRRDSLDVQQLADLVDRIGRREPRAVAG